MCFKVSLKCFGTKIKICIISVHQSINLRKAEENHFSPNISFYFQDEALLGGNLLRLILSPTLGCTFGSDSQVCGLNVVPFMSTFTVCYIIIP